MKVRLGWIVLAIILLGLVPPAAFALLFFAMAESGGKDPNLPAAAAFLGVIAALEFGAVRALRLGVNWRLPARALAAVGMTALAFAGWFVAVRAET